MTFPFYYQHRDGDFIKVTSPTHRIRIKKFSDIVMRTEELHTGATTTLMMFDVDRDSLRAESLEAERFEAMDTEFFNAKGNATPMTPPFRVTKDRAQA